MGRKLFLVKTPTAESLRDPPRYLRISARGNLRSLCRLFTSRSISLRLRMNPCCFLIHYKYCLCIEPPLENGLLDIHDAPKMQPSNAWIPKSHPAINNQIANEPSLSGAVRRQWRVQAQATHSQHHRLPRGSSYCCGWMCWLTLPVRLESWR